MNASPARYRIAIVDKPGLPARINQIGHQINQLRNATPDELVELAPELDKYVAALDALIGKDEEQQRRLKLAVINTLHRIPKQQAWRIPHKLGLRILHSLIHAHGPEAATNHVQAATGEDLRWSDVIRVYQPNYGQGNTTTLRAHQENVAAHKTRVGYQPRTRGKVAPRKTVDRPDPKTVRGFRAFLEQLETETVRVRYIVEATKDMNPSHYPPSAVLSAALAIANQR